ncbi:FAD-dependent oxidoreductase [Gordonia humi]|uniref:FAD-dependent oxidoreductase n=1 Tax=Gordonia humi TaxID=686429 RepID=UPI00361154F2
MDTDIVVIGGGVAGSAFAARMGAAGFGVIVLEREAAYRDMVRGEAMVPWGFLEAVELGVADAIMGADGRSVITRMVPYGDSLTVDAAQRRASDLTEVVPGAPGVIAVGHPELRSALADAAESAGATVLRGVRRSSVQAGSHPTVRYQRDGRIGELSCRLVVAADGKFSTTRAALGVDMHSTVPRVKLTGMLVDDGECGIDGSRRSRSTAGISTS